MLADPIAAFHCIPYYPQDSIPIPDLADFIDQPLVQVEVLERRLTLMTMVLKMAKYISLLLDGHFFYLHFNSIFFHILSLTFTVHS